jgi:sulfur-oxidizing protein SoxY
LQSAQAALGAASAAPGDAVHLDTPPIVTSTGAVNVAVSAQLSGITQIAILVHRAAFPLAVLFRPDGVGGPYEATVHLSRTDRVTVLVQADGKWYSASREIKVAAQPW